MVNFYAPWCRHSQALAAEYDRVAAAFADHGDGVVVATVNADKERRLGAECYLSQFPSLRWFSKGSTECNDFEGAHEAFAISSWISDKTGMFTPHHNSSFELTHLNH
jgi:thioredoxin-like negative regulator of GroEL